MSFIMVLLMGKFVLLILIFDTISTSLPSEVVSQYGKDWKIIEMKVIFLLHLLKS